MHRRTWKMIGTCRALAWLLNGVLGLCLAAGCGRTTVGGGSSPTDGKTGAVRVETVEVSLRDLNRTIEMPGTVEGYETADLYAKVGGYLEEILVDIGDRIKKDQVLARLYVPEMLKELGQKQSLLDRAKADVDQSRAAIRQAEAKRASAKASWEEAKSEQGEKEAHFRARQADLKRIQALVNAGNIREELLTTAQEEHAAAESALGTMGARIRTAAAEINVAQANLDKATADLRSVQAGVEVARANYDYVQTMLDYSTIKAPFDGLVIKRFVHSGAFIQPAEGNSAAKPLLQVTRTDRVRVSLDVPMAEVRLLDRGDRAVLDRINVLPGQKFEGEVTRFSTALALGSRMMRVEVDLENSQRRLMPGYYGYVTVYLDQYPQTPVIPSSALLSNGSEKYVYVVQDGRARKRVVRTNYEDGKIVGIASGLQGGEKVVRAGGGQISDDQPVTSVLAQ